MKKNQFIKKMNNQKGITAADITISMLIILTSIAVIGMVYTNLIIGSKDVDRKAKATQIATTILEHFEASFYDDIENNELQAESQIYNIPDGTFGLEIPSAYQVQIELKKAENDAEDIAKEVIVIVTYKTNGQEEKIQLSKVFEREILRECNSPKFQGEYLKQLGIEDQNYLFGYDTTAKDSAGSKIICPIKYNSELGKYQLLNKETIENNEIWYSYANKQWARVLVLEQNKFKTAISSDTSAVQDTSILTDAESSYIWIPRFGIEVNGELFGNTFFKYKSTNIAIMNSYYDENENKNLIYNYLDLNEKVQWSSAYSILFDDEENNNLGEWVSYQEIRNPGTDAYKLNHSQYGPIIEY